MGRPFDGSALYSFDLARFAAHYELASSELRIVSSCFNDEAGDTSSGGSLSLCSESERLTRTDFANTCMTLWLSPRCKSNSSLAFVFFDKRSFIIKEFDTFARHSASNDRPHTLCAC